MRRDRSSRRRELERQGEEHRAGGGVAADRHRLRRVHGLGDGEGRAVGEDAARRGDGDPPRLGERRIEGERAVPPALQPAGLEQPAHQRLGVAVLLLEVLRPEEETLRPEHPVAVAHAPPLPLHDVVTPRPDEPSVTVTVTVLPA